MFDRVVDLQAGKSLGQGAHVIVDMRGDQAIRRGHEADARIPVNRLQHDEGRIGFLR
jgi:hypothetical protein